MVNNRAGPIDMKDDYVCYKLFDTFDKLGSKMHKAEEMKQLIIKYGFHLNIVFPRSKSRRFDIEVAYQTKRDVLHGNL